MKHRTWVEVNAQALTHNIQALRSLLNPEARFCAVVKANAYGHGLKEVDGIWSSELVQDTARTLGFSCELQPALTWKTRIAQIKSFSIGTPIGYGLTEVMKKSGRVAVLPIGYWDGYDRRLSSSGEVLIKGIRCKVLGRICMNMMMVDVSQVPHPQKEDEVTLVGTQGCHRITADDLAHKLGSVSYEVVTRINPLIPRIIT